MTQGQLFDPSTVNARQFEPVPHVVEGARRYTAQAGMPSFDVEDLASRQVNPRLGHAVAKEYDKQARVSTAMRAKFGGDAPPSRATARSFDVMHEHINRQYEHMTKPEHEGGMGIKVEIHHGETYSSPAEMAADVRENKRIKVQSTWSTSGGQERAHDVWSNEVNDRFRAVHDVFAHATTGRSFSRHGEDVAYIAHSRMFPKEAHEALASETRGQNMQMNWGTGVFMGVDEPQHMVGAPSWVVEPESQGPPQPKGRVRRREGRQGTLALRFPK